MTAVLGWLVGLLSFAVLVTARFAFVFWRNFKWASEDNVNPLALRATLKRIVLHAEYSGDLHGLAEARDAMASGFEAAEGVFAVKVRGYERSQVIRTSVLRRIDQERRRAVRAA